MTATTRTPLNRCSRKGCPFTPDEHDEWMEVCSRAPEHGHRHDEPTHQHFPKKGMGGNNPKSKIVAVLCWPLHDRIDNKDFGNAVLDVGDGTKLYRIFDYKNATILEVKYERLDNNLDSNGKPVGLHDDGVDGGVDDSDSHPEVAASAGAPPVASPELAEDSRSPVLAGAGGEPGSVPTTVSPDFSPALTDAEGKQVAKDGEQPCGRQSSPVCGTGSHNRGGGEGTYKAAEVRVGPVSPSAFSLDSDWTALDDETLQSLYDEGEQRQQEGYLLKCKAVWTYRERHVQQWGESWTGQAIERFGCSRRYAYSYANLWQIYVTSDTYLREGMAALTDSRSLMQTIGRASVEEGTRLLESAVAHVAEYAQPPSVQALVGAETPERKRHDCPTCGFTHWAVVESEWK